MIAVRTVFASLVILLFAIAANATVLANWSLEEVLRRGDSVVIGVVGEQWTVDSAKGQLFTETEIAIEQTLRGAPASTLVISQIGGTKNGTQTQVVGDARLTSGDRVMLVTFAHQDGRRYLVGMALGAFRLSEDGATAFQEIETSLVEPNGLILPAPGERSVKLSDVKAALARIEKVVPSSSVNGPK